MLELIGLRKRFGTTVALDGLNLTVRPGEMVGFVGTNGAGKTTAMRIVLGVLAADAGEVHWHGHPVDEQVRSTIGYMPEERGLYPKMRVLDHLVYLARLHGAQRPVAQAAAQRWAAELGVSARAGDRVEALSLGNQQRVQLAAALVHDPVILVLDEPFSGLDPVGVDVLAAVLRSRVQAGAAVVFSSHQLDLVERLCDSVGIVSAGRIVAAGTVAELRARGHGPGGGAGQRRFRVQIDAGPGWPDRFATDLAVHAPGAQLATSDDPRVTAAGDQARDTARSEMTAAGGLSAGSGDHRSGPGPGEGPARGADPPGAVVLVDLPSGVDDQAVLACALRIGAVRSFGPVTPTLGELFREVVAP